jgi:GTP-binding protein LepA
MCFRAHFDRPTLPLQGFLGLLHMEIIQERLQREYDIDLIVTAPSVVYKVCLNNSEKELIVDTPSKMPDLGRNDVALEPYVRLEILSPSEYNGAIMELCQERRGELIDISFVNPTRSTIIYEMPLAEVITDFFNSLKSATKGYASMGFEIIEYRPSDLVRLDVKINYEVAPPLACICHRDKAQSLGRKLCASLKEQ